jgi:hypothetical protein
MPKGRRDADGKACKDADGKVTTCCTVPCVWCDTAPRTWEVNLAGIEINPQLDFGENPGENPDYTILRDWILARLAETRYVPFSYSDAFSCSWVCRVHASLELGIGIPYPFVSDLLYFIYLTETEVRITVRMDGDFLSTALDRGLLFQLTLPRSDNTCVEFSGNNELTEFGPDLPAPNLGKNGSVTLDASDTPANCGAVFPPPTCRSNCPDTFCLEAWVHDGSTLTKKRWLLQRTGPSSWQALHPQGAPASDWGALLTCNEDPDNPRWLLTLTDSNLSPLFGVIVFSGDATVCPNAVGLWKLVSSTEGFPFVSIAYLVESTTEDDCQPPQEPAQECNPCGSGVGTFVWDYVPGDPLAADGGCRAITFAGLFGSLALTWNAGTSKFEGNNGIALNTPGHIHVTIERTGQSGGNCHWLVIFFAQGDQDDGFGSLESLTLAETFYGDAFGFTGAPRPTGGCDGAVPASSKWNARADLTPTECRDPGLETCGAGAPNAQGWCP